MDYQVRLAEGCAPFYWYNEAGRCYLISDEPTLLDALEFGDKGLTDRRLVYSPAEIYVHEVEAPANIVEVEPPQIVEESIESDDTPPPAKKHKGRG